MALITTFDCPCGERYCVYIPKQLLFREIFKGDGVGFGSGMVLGKMLDQQRSEREEVALIGEAAELCGFIFKDISTNEVIQCSCGRVFDLLRVIRLDLDNPDLELINYIDW